MNEDKCNLLITNQNEDCILAHTWEEIVGNSRSEKLLGIIIDNK